MNCWLVFNRWGPQLEQATYKNRQRLYLSEQVSFSLSLYLAYSNISENCSHHTVFFSWLCHQTDGSVPNTLVIANCEVVKPRVAAAEHISQVFCGLYLSCAFCLSYSPLQWISCCDTFLLSSANVFFSSMKKHVLHLWRSTRPSFTLERCEFCPLLRFFCIDIVLSSSIWFVNCICTAVSSVHEFTPLALWWK